MFIGRWVVLGLLLGTFLSAPVEASGVAWNGEETPARGKGWSQPATCRVEPVSERAHSGSHCLRIELKGDGWKGVGWNWFGWYPPDAHTDAQAAGALVFWLRASRPDVALQLRIVDNHKGASAQIDLADQGFLKTLPTSWHEVRVPLAAFGDGFDRSRLWEIHFGTASPGDLTLWVDDIGFEAEGRDSPSAGVVAKTGRSISVRAVVKTEHVLHPISPLIYGASAVEPPKAREYGLTTVRWGGNRTSRYNWKAQADNAGSDWFFLNGKAGRWTDFVAGNRKAGLTSYLTLPMLPWVAKSPEGWSFSVARYGPQRKVEPYVSDRGDGVRPDGTPITGNDPRDASVPSSSAFQVEGIKALLRGKENSPPIVYALDNEPMLWHQTHRDVHPAPASYDDVFRLGKDFALAIKQADPRAQVAGPCTWGWTDLNFSAADEGTDRYASHADRRAHGDLPFLAWYLAAMNDASKQAHQRLLDFVDVHFYPQGQADGQGVYGGKSHSAAMRALRLRSTRGLWDRSYRDESWIKEPVALIPRVRGWIDQHNPGTKLSIGEYSWGGDDDPSGAIAQAEILGIFAREGVDSAFFWAGLGGVQRFAFQLYRNPDGHGQGFGDQYLASHSSQPETLSLFAARRSSDHALTIALVNKDLDRPAEVRLDLSGKHSEKASLFRLPNPPEPITRETVTFQGKSPSVTVPALSAALIVVD
ncbi:MAG TPA: glycoside hydrolase family 44 protein [Isosphaeraceae bacterium]|jgi:hypothetical protein|nr:glycoside hydrolase family 44 protein [Isosphaeraceae bacterium]